VQSPPLPSGTVTFLFTDIEGSTRLLQELGDRYSEALSDHRRLLRTAFRDRGGVEVDTQGDAFFYAFAKASDATAAASEGQAALAEGQVRVRMGLHTGEPTLTAEGYVGIDVHRAARICSAAHGGQVLLSGATAKLVDVDLHDLGEHRLKDLSAPQHLYQLGHGQFPPLRTLNQTNLPVQPTAFLGREHEFEQAKALLREHRLVTLVGPGGAGKTRLALQVAADAVEDFPDGVFWVPVAAIRDADLVEPAVAQAMGVTERLADHLAGKEALFLLDNLEQVVDSAPHLAELLREAPRIKLLVTSREPLRLRGEWEYLVPPMPQRDATALFAERARALRTDFEPDAAVVEICRQLDGLPLAIELAAARVKLLTPSQILERLVGQVDLLTAGARDVPDRQRTLRATITWSYELLTPEERELFARLGVFSGGWTLDSAEAVCDANLETLGSLVDKSLVRLQGERFSMLATIHEYAVERLNDSGQDAAARERHAQHFLSLAERAEPELFRPGQETWIPRLNAEHDNLRAALAHFVDVGASDLELRVVVAMWDHWYSQGLWSETTRALEHALAKPSADARARLIALRGLAWMAWRQGDTPGGRSLAQESVHLGRELGDVRLLGHSLRTLAVTFMREDTDAAIRLLEESADCARVCGDLDGSARATSNLALIRQASGDYTGAVEGHEVAVSLAREIGDGIYTAVYLLNLAVAQGHLHDYAQARVNLAECIRGASRLGIRECVVEALYRAAEVAAGLGDYGWTAAIVGTAQREGDFGFRFEEDDEGSLPTVLAEARQHLGDERFDAAVAAGRSTTLDTVLDYLQKGGVSAGEPVDAIEAFSLLDGLDSVPLRSFAVAGNYMRHDPFVRSALKDARRAIVAGLEEPGHRRNNHLIWAAPGSGKTYFVEQVARELGNATYRELNLAECDEAAFRAALETVAAPANGPCLCLVDECDARPSESWPYELLLPVLDAALAEGSKIVFVLAGSTASSVEEMKQAMASRPKGADLVSRIPYENVYSIAPMNTGDRVVVALAQFESAARQAGRDLCEVEKMALFYLAVDPRLGNARQLRELTVRAIERLQPGEDRVKYDHLFSPGNPENKAFWMQWQAHHGALVNRFIAIAP
jgi:predicted ATPase/tetratricopeptide (TPR) repeat protein